MTRHKYDLPRDPRPHEILETAHGAALMLAMFALTGLLFAGSVWAMVSIATFVAESLAVAW